jgi:hypothetical protein
MGYKADNQGIMNRYINVNGAWESHLLRTRQFILKSLAGKQLNNLDVLGSGWLLDLPLEELAGMAGHIRLYDLMHPSQVLHRLKRYSHVNPVQADITGGAVINAYQAVKEYKKHGVKLPPEKICDASFRFPSDSDCIISLNVYSQIGQMITDFLKDKIPYETEEADCIIFLLQQAHLKLLTPGKSLLISDIREEYFDANGILTGGREHVKCPFPVAEPAESWEWQFDPTGEYINGRKTVLQVNAFQF